MHWSLSGDVQEGGDDAVVQMAGIALMLGLGLEMGDASVVAPQACLPAGVL